MRGRRCGGREMWDVSGVGMRGKRCENLGKKLWDEGVGREGSSTAQNKV